MTDITLDEYKHLSADQLVKRLRIERMKMLSPNPAGKGIYDTLKTLKQDLMTSCKSK